MLEKNLIFNALFSFIIIFFLANLIMNVLLHLRKLYTIKKSFKKMHIFKFLLSFSLIVLAE